ncbi:Alpha/Beta hydrolase protein [Aspergillus pseudoustus]|uniref:Alpha/Beta hydrolase protein n=1 Tax=Aspergillus pseudoustus TaxID=1810923 RepID=A0ABR4IYK6_9EURO
MVNVIQPGGHGRGTPILSAWDICSALVTLVVYAPLSVLTSICHIGWFFQWSNLGEQISHDLLLCLGRYLPVSVIQRASDNDGNRLRQSHRYANAPFQLAERVQSSGFAGYWLYRHLSIESRPHDADLVLFHLHGGGYVMGHPLDNAPELLLVAEALSRRNHTVAVFSLEYTLVPNAPLPAQLYQTVAAYTWLTNELNVDPSKLYLIGESAGGHLIISLLVAIHQRIARHQPSVLPKPAAAFLISPWVNLNPCGPYARAKDQTLDPRSATFKHVLERFSILVRHDVAPEHSELYGNFAFPASERGSWKDILPTRTWVSAGTAEPLFRFDIEEFVESARRDGAEVRFELAEGKVHVWQSVEAREHEKDFLALFLGRDNMELMPGYQHIAELICSCLEGRS